MFKLISKITLPPDQIKETFITYLNSYSTKYGEFPAVLQLAVPVNSSDPLAWLKNQPFEQKNYWYDKKASLEIAGIGIADLINGEVISDYSKVIQEVQKYSSFTCKKCRYFGGFSFYKNVIINDEWQSFGAYRFVLPLFEIAKDGSDVLFKCNIIRPDENVINRLIRELEKVNFRESNSMSDIPVITNIISRPEKDEWQDMIKSALKNIHSADYEKIVLARKIEVEMQSQPDAFSVLSVLRDTNHHTVSFLFQPETDIAFIGTTPELLYRRDGRNLVSEAVAGTRQRGQNIIEDERLAEELLTNEKELREHKYVARSLKTNLSHLCDRVEPTGDVSVLKLSQLQHLYMPFNGSLKPDITDGDILEAIHPTPAVGGYPEKSVLPILQETEPFNRGWYAAPVGWTAADSATFAVAIRSALVIKNKFLLYSGAGIVDGSSPEKEWEELDNKIYHYTKVLNFDSKLLEKHQQLLGLLTH